jgi:hypothetical protein
MPAGSPGCRVGGDRQSKQCWPATCHSTCLHLQSFTSFWLQRKATAKPIAEGQAGGRGLAAEAISQFYADLVQTSGVRWTAGDAAAPATQGLAAQPPAAVAAGVAVEGPSGTQDTQHGEALPQHAMDRATVTEAGVVILQPPPRADDGAGDGPDAPAAAAATASGHEPAEPAQPGPSHYGISRRNVGYQLLQKAGWTEGTGLGAQEQGRREPLAPAAVRGQAGLGFQPGGPGRRGQKAGGAAAQPGQQPGQQQGGREEGKSTSQEAQQQQPKRPLPPDPLEKEDKETKLKRVKQVQQCPTPFS